VGKRHPDEWESGFVMSCPVLGSNRRLRVLHIHDSAPRQVDLLLLRHHRKLRALSVEGATIKNTRGLTQASAMELLDLSDPTDSDDVLDLTFLRHLKSLRACSLASAQIKSIPRLDALVKLEYLNLASNKLGLLPFAGMKSLRYLDISFNPFENLEALDGCRALKTEVATDVPAKRLPRRRMGALRLFKELVTPAFDGGKSTTGGAWW
jgi:Leucine-rich repeat (LRR) protein